MSGQRFHSSHRIAAGAATAFGALVIAACASTPAASVSDEQLEPSSSVAAAPLAPKVEAPELSTSAKLASRVPAWTVNGSSEGSMVLRCENAFPPEDRSGKCSCEGFSLELCVDGNRQLVIDRKQCGFACKPKPQDAKRIALSCPDGSTADASTEGCACSGRKPLDPCVGGIASAVARNGECVVTCKQDQ